ncbi:MAG: hypothetical protein KGQ36_00855 [Rickettsiales bacterium]|nr:hypothetical protein [Rickettsiales bacterium]
MKKILTLSTALLSSLFFNEAFAADGMRLDSLMFRPAKKQLVSITTISSETKKFNEINSLGQYNKKELNNSGVSNIFDYGITDKLNAFTILEYNKEETTTLGTTTKEKSKGFENPIFALKYRFLNQQVNGINFDVILPISFNIINSKVADSSTHTTGTVADGRNSYALRLDLGRYIGDFGFVLSGGAQHFTDAKSIKQDGSFSRASESNNFGYSAEVQYRFNYGSISLNATRTKYGSFRDGSNQKYSLDDSKSYFVNFSISGDPKKYDIELKLKTENGGDIFVNSTKSIKNVRNTVISSTFRYSF